MTTPDALTMLAQGGPEIFEQILPRAATPLVHDGIVQYAKAVADMIQEKYIGADLLFSLLHDANCELSSGEVIEAELITLIVLGATNEIAPMVVSQMAMRVDAQGQLTQIFRPLTELEEGEFKTKSILALAGAMGQDPVARLMRTDLSIYDPNRKPDFDWVLMGEDAMALLAQIPMPPPVTHALKDFFDQEPPADYPMDLPVQIGLLKLPQHLVVDAVTGASRHSPVLEINMHRGKTIEELQPGASGELWHAQIYLELDLEGKVLGIVEARAVH